MGVGIGNIFGEGFGLDISKYVKFNSQYLF